MSIVPFPRVYLIYIYIYIHVQYIQSYIYICTYTYSPCILIIFDAWSRSIFRQVGQESFGLPHLAGTETEEFEIRTAGTVMKMDLVLRENL